MIDNSQAGSDWSAYYSVTHADEFPALDWRAFYERVDRYSAATRSELKHDSDLRYGDHPKQTFDVYYPVAGGEPASLFIFFHGGGFREGDRALYGYVARTFASLGVITAVPSYRLLPMHDYFSARDDARTAVRAVLARVDPDRRLRVVVGGHSAGAMLAASLAGDQSFFGEDQPRIFGLLAASGAYDLTVDVHQPYLRESMDPSRWREASPLLNVTKAAQRTLAVIGSEENVRYVEATQLLADAFARAGATSLMLALADHKHDDTALALADSDSLLSKTAAALLFT